MLWTQHNRDEDQDVVATPYLGLLCTLYLSINASSLLHIFEVYRDLNKLGK